MSSQERPGCSTVEPTTSEEVEVPSPIPSTSQEGSNLVEETSVLEIPDQPDLSLRPACVDCAHLLTENRKLSRNVKTLRQMVKRRQKEVKTYRRKSKSKVTFCFPFLYFYRSV